MMRSLVTTGIVIQVLFAACLSHAQQYVVSADLPPFVFRKGGEITGIATDVLRLAARYDPGLTPEIELMPWKRSLEYARTGAGPAIIPLARTPEREDDFHWIGPLFVATTWLWSNPGTTNKPHTVKDAMTLSVGVLKGGAGGERLKSMGFSNLATFHGLGQMIQRLRAGDINVMRAPDLMVRYHMRSHGMAVDDLEPCLAMGELEFYLGLSKSHPVEMAQSWNIILERTKQDPDYATLITKYGLDRQRNGLPVNQ